MNFNEGQRDAISKMEAWLKTNEPFFILSGISGSGKTSTLKHVISKIDSDKIVLTAPNTEALEAIAGDLPQYSAMTIHKLLGFRPTETSDEKQILVRAGAKKNKEGKWSDPPPKAVNYLYVVLDEAYYCPGGIIDSIFNNYRHIKWIFLGDYKQLPPVEESESRLLQYESRVDYKSDLQEDMRSTCLKQKALVGLTRQKGLRTDFSPYVIPKSKALRNLMSVYDGNPDKFSFVALAYEHVVVDKVAADVRDIIYNYSHDTPPQPGEIVRVTGTVDEDGNELVRTNERVKVIHYEEDMVLVKRKNGEEVALFIDNAGELDSLFQQAKISRLPSDWRTYYHRARQYVQIKSAFAMTIHSAQGRTEENSLIILDNMLKCRSDNLTYVAVGRSRNVPWFVQNW
jgi:energy-coupling factor transporter ATP-binding protein EcfA2